MTVDIPLVDVFLAFVNCFFLKYLTVNPSWKMPVTSHGRDFPFYQRCWFYWKELHVWIVSASNTCDICYTCEDINFKTLLNHALEYIRVKKHTESSKSTKEA